MWHVLLPCVSERFLRWIPFWNTSIQCALFHFASAVDS
jgi:hypothetical protein